MQHGIDGIKIAVGVIIVCVLVGLAFFVLRTGKQQVNQATAQLVGITSEFDEPAKLVYDGITCDGNEVISAISKFSGDDTVAVRVEHKNGTIDVYNGKTAGTRPDGALVADANFVGITDAAVAAKTNDAAANKLAGVYDKSLTSASKQFINKGTSWMASVQRNSDDVIACITFTQQ